MSGRASSSASGATPSSAKSQFSVPIRSCAVSTSVPSRSSAITAPDSAALLAAPSSAPIDDRSRLVEVRRIVGQGQGRDPDVLLGVLEPPLLDRLAHPRQGLGAIAGEA